MKGSDLVKMTINIGGELIKLDVNFDDQNKMRDTERDVKAYIDRLRKAFPDNSDRNLLAMALFQFALWYDQLKEQQEKILEITANKCQQIDQALNKTNLTDTV